MELNSTYLYISLLKVCVIFLRFSVDILITNFGFTHFGDIPSHYSLVGSYTFYIFQVAGRVESADM